jgi:hypothetical protein
MPGKMMLKKSLVLLIMTLPAAAQIQSAAALKAAAALGGLDRIQALRNIRLIGSTATCSAGAT